MTDPWARPAEGREYVEVQLTDVDGDLVGGCRADDRPRDPGSRRRRWAPAFGVAAVVAGVVTVAAVSTGDDESTSPTASTLLDTSLIPTPPTLPSLETVPAATLPGTDEPSDTTVVGAPGSTTNPTLDPASVVVREFPVVAGVDAAELGRYDLVRAVGANVAGGEPRRTTMTLDGVQLDGLYRTRAELIVVHDPVARRDSLSIAWDVGSPAQFVADRATDTLYRTDAGLEGRWEQFDPVRFTTGTGTGDLGELLDSFVTGPVTTAALAASTVGAADDLVELDDGVIARPYTVTTPIGSLVPYGVLLLANVVDDTVADGDAPTAITFTVYVTAESELALVTARFETGYTAVAIELGFGRPDGAVTIELPADDMLVSRPAPEPAP